MKHAMNMTKNSKTSHRPANRLMIRVAASLSCAAALMTCGCDTVRAPYNPPGDPLPAENYPKVAYLDKELQNMLVVDPARVVQDSSDGRPLSVMVPLRSVVEHTMNLQYQYSWRDSVGREIGKSGWRFVRVEPRVQVQCQGNAITKDATDWRLEVRFDR
jgi:Protein of unknown function (DUF1425)